MRPDIEKWYFLLPEEWREQFDERCAIREYDGNMTKDEAEIMTYSEYSKIEKGV